MTLTETPPITVAFVGPAGDLDRLRRAGRRHRGASSADAHTPSITWATDRTPARTEAAVLVHTGGGERGHAQVRDFLSHGRPVITADVALVAGSGPELRRLAADRGTRFRGRAAAVAAVPAITDLPNSLPSDASIRRVDGLLSPAADGFVRRLGRSRPPTVNQTQRRRAAASLDGREASQRLAVVMQELTASAIPEELVLRLGISGLSNEDVVTARARQRTWRLVATAVTGACARVEPMALPVDHPLVDTPPGALALLVTTDDGTTCLVHGPAVAREAVDRAILQDLAAADDRLPATVP